MFLPSPVQLKPNISTQSRVLCAERANNEKKKTETKKEDSTSWLLCSPSPNCQSQRPNHRHFIPLPLCLFCPEVCVCVCVCLCVSSSDFASNGTASLRYWGRVFRLEHAALSANSSTPWAQTLYVCVLAGKWIDFARASVMYHSG